MDAEPSLAAIGALIGSPARAAILAHLFDGRAMTATELSHIAGVSSATTSEHLAKLTSAGLLIAERHGRHRYYRLSGHRVAEALEPLVELAPSKPVPARRHSPELDALRQSRLCYDHLAGALGVMLTDALLGRGYLALEGRDFDLTPEGIVFLEKLGVDVTAARKQRRIFARQCLDWSERRPHVSGALGAAMADMMFKRGWIARTQRRREVAVTKEGRLALALHFGVDWP